MKRLCKPGGFVLLTVMHPAMSLRGVQARFVDPDTGCQTRLAGVAHTISDYVTAVVRSGLQIVEISEHVVDEMLAASSPRARKYQGWPMLLMMKLCG